MRLFVYEWTCCTPDAPPPMRREGWAMLWAVLSDLQQTRWIDTVTLVHESLAQLPPGEVQRIRDGTSEAERFRDLAASAEATLVIAPETDGLLLDRCRSVEAAGGLLLGPTSDAIALTTDKVSLAAWWTQHGVPTPATIEMHTSPPFPVVVKPRDGAGSQATFRVCDATTWEACIHQASAEGFDDLIAQPFAAGQSASLAFLIGPRAKVALQPAAQHLSGDGRLRYQGGTAPLPSPLAERALTLARRAIETVPGLRGYVGVDLVLGDTANQDLAIEINPRLTTSYIGLRMQAETNLADAMLRIFRGEEVELRWRPQQVQWWPDGSIATKPRPA